MTDTRTTEELYLAIEGALDDEREHESGLAIDALDTLTSRLEAYEAEHQAAREVADSLRDWGVAADAFERTFIAAHDNAERVRRGD